MIFVLHQKSDKVIERTIKSQPKLGSRDRKFIAETIYEIVRAARYLAAGAGLDDQIFMDSTFWRASDFWTLWGAYLTTNDSELPDWEEVADISWNEDAFDEWPRTWRHSLGDELDEIGFAELGEEWESFLVALNEPAEVYLRTNLLLTTPEELVEKLKVEEIETEIVEMGKPALRMIERKNTFQTKCFREGLFEIQDLASQMVAEKLAAQPRERVIDACAGAGGKSLHIANYMKNKGKIISLDIYDKKLLNLKQRARRNKIDIIETKHIDTTKVIKRLEKSADRLLLDVPCTGSGVIRRNPDAKWRISRQAHQELLLTQQEILQNYSSMVRPGGRLVYSTCSVFPSENQKQIEVFMQKQESRWKLIAEDFCDPRKKNWDGFFIATLERLV